MKVKMLKHVHGTVDGVKMGPYVLDTVYDTDHATSHGLDEKRAKVFIGSAMAEKYVEPPPPKAKADSKDK